MQAIKSFIYLDEYKMYSISSQIFEGTTEYVMSYQESTIKREEEQKGPIGSGRFEGDILKSESGTQKKKYLHDYSYTLFEERLEKLDKIHNLSAENINEEIKQIEDAGFIKVRAKVIFDDINIIKSTVEKINELGEAFAYITNFEKIEEVRQQLETAAQSIKDRKQKAKLRQKLKAVTDIKTLAKSLGLYQDPVFIEKLGVVLDYGFQNHFIVRMPIGSYTFSADCKREDLREDEHSLIRKYSRLAEKEFVLVGTIAQGLGTSDDYQRDKANQDDSKTPHLKESIMSLVEGLSAVEFEFSGKIEDEIIVDPIAIYREI